MLGLGCFLRSVAIEQRHLQHEGTQWGNGRWLLLYRSKEELNVVTCGGSFEKISSTLGVVALVAKVLAAVSICFRLCYLYRLLHCVFDDDRRHALRRGNDVDTHFRSSASRSRPLSRFEVAMVPASQVLVEPARLGCKGTKGTQQPSQLLLTALFRLTTTGLTSELTRQSVY